MGWVVAALVALLGALGAYFGMRSKFSKVGYDLAIARQASQASMVQKEVERKDKAIDAKVIADRIKIQGTKEKRLQDNTGSAANRLIARALKPWRILKNK